MALEDVRSPGGNGAPEQSGSRPPHDNPLAVSTLTVGGMKIARLSRGELAGLMHQDVTLARQGVLAVPRVITSANGSVVAAYHSDPVQRRYFDAADLVDADGMPLVFASRLFCRTPLSERTATTDFLLDACETAAREGIRFFFLGSRPGVAMRAADHLRSRYPGLQVAGCHHGYFGDGEIDRICAAIVASRADVLWVGTGSPRQERFAVENRHRLAGVAWIRTCGGLFDHYGGGVSRAPDWMQSLGLEWLYRAAREPIRLGWRYLVTSPVAIYHLLTKTHD